MRRSRSGYGALVLSLVAGAALVTSVAPSIGQASVAGAHTATCGTSWSVVESDANSYTGISSLSSTDVWAVGFSPPHKGAASARGPLNTVVPAAVHWDGTAWSASTLPVLDVPASEFNAVSMAANGSGWAVGYSQVPTGSLANAGNGRYDTLAEHWNGTSWKVIPTPNVGAGTNLLISVSTLSSKSAWAVGYGSVSNTTPRQTLAEQWNGTQWNIVPTPVVGTYNDALLGVSSVSSSDAWAVGYSTNSTSQDSPLIEHWDGSTWTAELVDPSTPAGVFTAVSATSTDAWAVGYTDADQPLIEHWDGTAWSLVPPPAIGGVVQIARSVLDESPSSVWVAGTDYQASLGAYVGFLMQWNGSSWNVQTPATPPNPIADENKFQFRSISATAGGASVWAAGGIPDGLVEEQCPGSGSAGPVASRSPEADLQPAGATTVRQTAVPARPTAGKSSDLTVVDEASHAGIGTTTFGESAIVADFDGNGSPDIFLSRPAILYRNNGNGTFTQIDDGTFPSDDRFDCTPVYPTGQSRPDIYCTIGANRSNGLKANEFWVQGAATAFSDQADSYGLLDPTGRGRAAAFFAGNGSTPPALWVANDPFRADGLPDPDRLFVDTPTGWVDSPQLALDVPIGGDCASTGDYLRSGYQDLLVCPANGPVQLFQNKDGSGFANVTAQAGLAGKDANDAIFADLNGDGWPDVVLVSSSKLSVMLQNPATHRFRLSYTLPLTGGVSVAAGDANGDGALDLLVTEGPGPTRNSPADVLLVNNGAGTGFTSQAVPQPPAGSPAGHAFPIDYEGNGMTDFLVLHSQLTVPGPLQLLTFFP